MKMEDFRFELFELRDLARAKGVDRLKRVGRLLRKHPDTGKSALIWAGVAILLCVCTIAQGRNGSLRARERWLDAVVCICYMVPIVIAYICSMIGRLIAASKRLNERAEMLGEDEFKRISESLEYVPKWSLNGSAPENLSCGCYGCIKMVPVGSQICSFCKKHRLVHGDSTHPLDEDRLKAIHDLLLKGERA